jgi:hypothetical protein
VHGAIGVAASCTISAGKLFHRIGHIGVGIEQAGRAAALTHSARSAKPNLHQAIIAGVDDTRIAAALTPNNTAHHALWNVVGGRMPGDKRIEIAVGVERLAWRCCAETGDAKAASATRIVASESLRIMSPPLLAGFYATLVGDLGLLARNSGEFAA